MVSYVHISCTQLKILLNHSQLAEIVVGVRGGTEGGEKDRTLRMGSRAVPRMGIYSK